MKRTLIVGAVLLLIGIGIFTYFRNSKGLAMPMGTSGPEAELLAQRMMDACNAEAWDQTRLVQWTFAGRNSYVWDRSEGIVEVRSGDSRVIIHTDTQKGKAYNSGKEVFGERKDEALENAWSKFCNDSFWLAAPLKVMDPGTTRESVKTEEGECLMVHYSSGGVTPGDSYMWYIAEDGFPYAVRMWVKVLPVPGMRSTWEQWQTLHTGAKIATVHMLGPAEILITDLKSGSTFQDIDLDPDYFQ